MKYLRILVIFAVFLLSTTGTASASLFSDNFNLYNGGDNASDFNFQTVDEKWTVANGTVDLIGNGTVDFIPGYGLYVDMDGSSGDSGDMVSRNFNLVNGSYMLSFDLAGNGQSSHAAVTVEIDGIFTESYLLDYDASFETFTKYFQIDNASPFINTNIKFLTTEGTNSGILLDNVLLEEASPVPIPGSILLLGPALIGIIGYRKKSKK